MGRDVDKLFSELVKLVGMGLTISGALKRLSVDRAWMYRHMSDAQKLELQLVKTTNTRYGQRY